MYEKFISYFGPGILVLLVFGIIVGVNINKYL